MDGGERVSARTRGGPVRSLISEIAVLGSRSDRQSNPTIDDPMVKEERKASGMTKHSYPDEAKVRGAWSGRGVYVVQYGEARGFDGRIEEVDNPRKFHADDVNDLLDQHECWVMNDILDLRVVSIEKMPSEELSIEEIRVAFEDYLVYCSTRDLESTIDTEAVLDFIDFLEELYG